MPATDPQAVLEPEDIRHVMAVARARGPEAFALLAWTYEFGARAAEPGLQLVRDIDLRVGRARPMHLKSGAAKSWQPLLPFCKEALPLWLDQHRDAAVSTPEQKSYLFPSSVPGRCYTCKGTGKRTRLLNNKGKRSPGEQVECHHCGGTSKRWGLSRFEVRDIISAVLREAKMPKGRQHPHVLRHSIITHLLDGGAPPKAIQDRVGHSALETTLGYAKLTKAATAALERAMNNVYGED